MAKHTDSPTERWQTALTEISPNKISLIELVPDGLGGYIERPASMAVNE